MFFTLLVLALSVLFLFFLSSSKHRPLPLASTLWNRFSSIAIRSVPSCSTCHMCGGLRFTPPFPYDADHFVAQVFNKLRSFWRKHTLPGALDLEPRSSPDLPPSVAHPSSELPVPQPCSSLLLPDNPHVVTNAGSDMIVPHVVTNASASSISSTSAETPVSSDMSTKAGINPNDAHFHRVILEILMSPSATSEGEAETRSDSASSLRLKLETNTTLEHLATLREAFAKQCTQKCKSNVAGSEGDSLFSLPADSDSGKSGKRDHHAANLFSVEINPEMSSKNLEVAHIESTLSQRESQKPHSEDTFVASSSNMVLSNGNSNLRTYRLNSANRHKQSFSESGDERNNFSEGNILSQDRLGSLQIAFFTSPSQATEKDQKVIQMDGPAVSALATINVANKSERNHELDVFRDDNSCDARGDCQGNNLLKAKEQCLTDDLSFKSFDGSASTCKKEKKKKKNRARKQKEKPDVSVVDAQEIQNIGKICLEAVKHASATSEREVGCICETPKGGVHTSSCPYPFTSSGSILQRKIKEQYDELVRCNAAKTLTLAQVGRFTARLVETKATLQQKSELIQRKFTITKSLLSKADKSSFDRLWGQIYGLEMEQKKLEEDTVVYNRLQEQLKLSPAYKKMLEYGRTHLEMQPHSGELIEKLEPDAMEMSFEEFLAQEKKDVYWQKHRIVRAPVQAR